jgi:hypothetical protein
VIEFCRSLRNLPSPQYFAVTMETTVRELSLSDLIQVEGNISVVPSFTVDAWGDDLPFDVSIDAVFEEGRFRANNISMSRRSGGPAITTERIRQVLVGRIMQETIESVTFYDGIYHLGRNPGEAAPRRGPDDETLRLVSIFYRVAYICGVPPTQYVYQRLQRPKPTVARWVQKARLAGYLGPSVGTRAGEATT